MTKAEGTSGSQTVTDKRSLPEKVADYHSVIGPRVNPNMQSDIPYGERN